MRSFQLLAVLVSSLHILPPCMLLVVRLEGLAKKEKKNEFDQFGRRGPLLQCDFLLRKAHYLISDNSINLSELIPPYIAAVHIRRYEEIDLIIHSFDRDNYYRKNRLKLISHRIAEKCLKANNIRKKWISCIMSFKIGTVFLLLCCSSALVSFFFW